MGSMQTRTLLAALAVLTCLAAATPAAAVEGGAAFLSAIDDLPLMEGLSEAGDAGSTFDTPAGRIVEAYAEGPTASGDEVARYYAATLPQLGWATDGGAVFRREGEVLKVEIVGERPLTVRFTLAPE